MSDEKDSITDLKVDVGVLKTQISILSQLCEKMDKVIERIVDMHDDHVSQIYKAIESRRVETDNDIADIHNRIDTVLEKLQDTETRIGEKLENLRYDINKHNDYENEKIQQLLKWKWVAAGGIIVMSWLITHIGPDTLLRLFK